MAGLIADQLRWAEINEAWAYMEKLLLLVHEMGGRVITLMDPRYRWRNDYLISFAPSDLHPILK